MKAAAPGFSWRVRLLIRLVPSGQGRGRRSSTDKSLQDTTVSQNLGHRSAIDDSTRRTRAASTASQSVHDVERVAQGLVEPGPGELVEMPDRLIVEVNDRDGDDVVAADDACFRKAVLRSKQYLRSDSANGPCDRCARDGGEHVDRSVASEHADGSSTSRWSEIGPVDVVASYHAGVVSAASRRADSTSAGSAGWRE